MANLQATAFGRGLMFAGMSRRAAKESFAATRLTLRGIVYHGL